MALVGTANRVQFLCNPTLTKKPGEIVDTLYFSSTVALAVHWMIVLGLSLRVIMRHRPIGVSLAWLAVIFSVPLFGALLYLYLGEKRLGRDRARRIDEVLREAAGWMDTSVREAKSSTLNDHAKGRALDRYVENVLHSPTLPGNTFQLLDHFQAIFDALIRDIDAAQRSIGLGFYIWHPGGRSDDVLDAVIRAARRGVACHVFVDSVGSKTFLRGPLPEQLREAGVRVVAALPTGLLRSLFVRADLRYHRKIATIDNRVAYTGSQNLVDPRYFKQDSGVGQWVDAMVRVEGPLVRHLTATFRLDWSVESGDVFDPPEESSVAIPAPDDASPTRAALTDAVETGAAPTGGEVFGGEVSGGEEPGGGSPTADDSAEDAVRSDAPQRTGPTHSSEIGGPVERGIVAQVVPSGPGLHPETIHQLLLTTMYAAERELILTTPYFVPDDAVITALLSAALRGVEVTVIVPAHNDSLLVRYASVAHFDDLMAAGVRIAHFHGGLLHTKSITVDGQLSVFGSVNLDMRSLWLNFEVSLFVYGSEFTSELRALQYGYLDDSDLLDLAFWRQRPFRRRLAENTLRLLSPLL